MLIVIQAKMGQGSTIALVRQLLTHIDHGDLVYANLRLSEANYIHVPTLNALLREKATIVVGIDMGIFWFDSRFPEDADDPIKNQKSPTARFLDWLHETKSTAYITTQSIGMLDKRIQRCTTLLLTAEYDRDRDEITLSTKFFAFPYFNRYDTTEITLPADREVLSR